MHGVPKLRGRYVAADKFGIVHELIVAADNFGVTACSMDTSHVIETTELEQEAAITCLACAALS